MYNAVILQTKCLLKKGKFMCYKLMLSILKFEKKENKPKQKQ